MPTGRDDVDAQSWRILAGTHRLLLRLAGRVPDDLLTHLRTLLSDGDMPEIPDVLVASSAQSGVSLTAAELDLMREVLGLFVEPRHPVGAEQVAVSETTPATGHRFAPVPAQALAAGGPRIPVSLDLTGGGSEDLTDLPDDLADLADLAEELTDLMDEATVIELSDREGVAGIWRAWRFAATGAPRDGRRVVLVEVAPDVPAWDVEEQVRQVLTDLGEDLPQIEVYWTGQPLTPYHRAARSSAALLWARDSARVRVAPVYGGAGASGPPGFVASQPRIPDGAGRVELLARLRAGSPVGDAAPGWGIDRVQPERGRRLPLAHRTDGRWVWSEAVAYYLAEYGLAPDPGLLQHLRAAEPRTEEHSVDGVDLFRAELALRSLPR